ncbi:MAG: hypothetical protein ACKVU4_06960 [Phycisphaerales bacterium]
MEARRGRLVDDISMWPDSARRAYRDRLRAAEAAGHPIDLGLPAESAAREAAEIAAGWHNGWPKRKPKPAGGAP